MHSPAKRTSAARERAEFALRLVALGALVFGVLQVAGLWGAKSESALPVVFTGGSGGGASRQPLIDVVNDLLVSEGGRRPLHLLANTVPDDTSRAIMTAAAAAGIPVSWTDSIAAAPVALEATSLVDPSGGVLLRAASSPGVALAFRDSVGLIDTVRTRGNGASMTLGHVAGSVRVSSARSFASVIAPPPATVRRILVIANPGWEAKFTTAALEERGWNVDVRYALGRNVSVTQGDPLIADTARYAVVVALDSAALPHVAEIRRYADAGGGVVVAGVAATLREFGDMLPGKTGAEQAGIPGALATDTPLDGVSWRPIAADTNAVVLQQSIRRAPGAAMSVQALAATKGNTVATGTFSDANSTTSTTASTRPGDRASARGSVRGATVVARRFGAGRVVMVAYDALWQWRMAGPDGSVEEHRKWWSNIIGLVAFAPESDTNTVTRANRPGNAAPYADLSARLGVPLPMPAVHASPSPKKRWELLILVTAVAALIVEWASRRLRGAR